MILRENPDIVREPPKLIMGMTPIRFYYQAAMVGLTLYLAFKKRR